MNIILPLSISPIYESILFPQHLVIEFETIKGHVGCSNLDCWLRLLVILVTGWGSLLLGHDWLAIRDFVLLLLSENLWLLVAGYLRHSQTKVLFEASLQ